MKKEINNNKKKKPPKSSKMKKKNIDRLFIVFKWTIPMPVSEVKK